MSWSIFAFVFLPDTPMNASFLTQQEKVFWVKRLASNKTGIVNNVWKWDQVVEAVIDPKTWLIFFFNIAINIPNGGRFLSVSTKCILTSGLTSTTGLTTFNGIIIKNLGFTSVQSSLLAMPTGVMSTLASIGFSLLAAKWYDRRCLVAMIACGIPITGTAVLYGVSRSTVSAQLVGLYLVRTSFYHLDFTLLIAIVLYLLRSVLCWNIACSSEHRRPYEEKCSVRYFIRWLCCG